MALYENEFPLGLVRVYWESGGSSVASIYQDGDGVKWIAPTNWVGPVKLAKTLSWIKHFDLVTEK